MDNLKITMQAAPEWDEKMKKALKKRKSHKEIAKSQLLKGLECLPYFESLEVIFEEAFAAGVEAEVHDF